MLTNLPLRELLMQFQTTSNPGLPQAIFRNEFLRFQRWIRAFQTFKRSHRIVGVGLSWLVIGCQPASSSHEAKQAIERESPVTSIEIVKTPSFIPVWERTAAFRHPTAVEAADQTFLVDYQSTVDLSHTGLSIDLEYADERLGSLQSQRIAANIPRTSQGFRYTWNTQALPEGLYSVQAIFKEGGQERRLVSQGAVSVVHGAVTQKGYYGDIQLLLQEQCEDCHRTGGAGHPAFDDYPSTMQAAASIRYYIRHGGRSDNLGYMPPWFAADAGTRFQRYRGLSEREIRKIEMWVDAGTPRGDLTQARSYQSPARVEPPGTPFEWQIPVAFQPAQYQKTAEDIYQCFLFDPQLTKTQYILASDVTPDNQAILHHVIIYALPTKSAQQARLLEAQDPDPGYRCYGGPLPGDFDGVLSDWQHVAGWAPGDRPSEPTGRGYMIPAGTLFAMQVHYHTEADPQGLDQSRFKLWMSEEQPKAIQYTIPVPNLNLNIPPGATHHEETVSYKVHETPDVDIHEVYPHAHLLGREISFSVTRATGETELLIHVPRWNFNWQGSYVLKQPFTFHPGDQLNLRCVYDNSTTNPQQPHRPPIMIHWGDASTDEMCLTYLMVTVHESVSGDVKTSTTPLDRATLLRRIFGEALIRPTASSP